MGAVETGRLESGRGKKEAVQPLPTPASLPALPPASDLLALVWRLWEGLSLLCVLLTSVATVFSWSSMFKCWATSIARWPSSAPAASPGCTRLVQQPTYITGTHSHAAAHRTGVFMSRSEIAAWALHSPLTTLLVLRGLHGALTLFPAPWCSAIHCSCSLCAPQRHSPWVSS